MTNEIQGRIMLDGVIAGAALLQDRPFARPVPGPELIPWGDQPPPVPPAFENVAKGLTRREELDSWITPNDEFFGVARYNRPVTGEKSWSLDVAGLVTKPLAFTFQRMKSPPTARNNQHHGMLCQQWSAIRYQCGRQRPLGGSFVGRDGPYGPDQEGRPRDGFTRCGSRRRGFEVRDTRIMGRFMGSDYITLREEQRGGKTIVTESSVGRVLLKSAPAKVTRRMAAIRSTEWHGGPYLLPPWR